MSLTRRDLLKSALATAAATALQPLAELTSEGGHVTDQPSSLKPQDSSPPQAFRFVHLTDIHIQHERDGDKGTAKALKAVEALKPRPDFILTGGDLVFDVLDVPADRAKLLFELYKQVLADNTSLPVYQTIGNHDVFGWHPKSGIKPSDIGYGKAMYKDILHLAETFHRFDHKGWRFFCLDNIQPGGSDQYPYEGYVDGPQLDWLKAELQKTDPKTPIIICEHIPSVTATPYSRDQLVQGKEWRVQSGFVCTDAPKRLAMYRTRNVRLCLSGHIHDRDRIEFGGMTFINDGAVCGSWWRGPHRGVQEGFGIIDCRADGTFDHQYFDYGWVAKNA
jgi:3',5'-cyclic AMP phosphodiesterase CpdA